MRLDNFHCHYQHHQIQESAGFICFNNTPRSDLADWTSIQKTQRHSGISKQHYLLSASFSFVVRSSSWCPVRATYDELYISNPAVQKSERHFKILLDTYSNNFYHLLCHHSPAVNNLLCVFEFSSVHFSWLFFQTFSYLYSRSQLDNFLKIFSLDLKRKCPLFPNASICTTVRFSQVSRVCLPAHSSHHSVLVPLTVT